MRGDYHSSSHDQKLETKGPMKAKREQQETHPTSRATALSAFLVRAIGRISPLFLRQATESGSCSRRLLVAFGAILAVQLLASCNSKHTPSSKLVGGPTYALSSEPPSIGNIDGVDFSIPQNYLLSRVVYAGQDAWTYSAKRETPSYKRVIDNIDIRLRLSNLAPIHSQADWNDWIRALNGKTFLYETWLTGSIFGRAEMYPPDGTYKTIIPRYWESSAPFGKFDIHESDQYGLAHYLVKKPQDGAPSELYFDPETWTNLITCDTEKGIPPLGVTTTLCDDSFLIPGLHGVVVQVHFAKSHLHQWRKIQARITQLIDSWIVEPNLN